MSRRLPVTRRDGSVRAYAIVDDADFPALSARKWHFCNGYVATSADGREHYLHRLLMGEPAGEVDHRNGDKLDHRRSNLRVTTPAQNKQNLGLRRDSRSGFRGVSWAPHVRLWRGRVHHDGKTYCCGYHADPHDAARAVSVRRRELMTHSEEARHEAPQQ